MLDDLRSAASPEKRDRSRIEGLQRNPCLRKIWNRRRNRRRKASDNARHLSSPRQLCWVDAIGLEAFKDAAPDVFTRRHALLDGRALDRQGEHRGAPHEKATIKHSWIGIILSHFIASPSLTERTQPALGVGLAGKARVTRKPTVVRPIYTHDARFQAFVLSRNQMINIAR